MDGVPIAAVPLVQTYGNRACLTDLVVAEFPADLQRWVRENCERPDNADLDIWLLPVPKEDA